MVLDLRCALLNAENLFLLLDQELPIPFDHFSDLEWQKYSTSIYSNKPLSKLIKLKTYLNEINPDILLLEEIGGEESLRNFNHHFLRKYSIFVRSRLIILLGDKVL